jgi:hypothetical protein
MQGLLLSIGVPRMLQGTGYEAAVVQEETITSRWLAERGVTVQMVRAWRRFYEEVSVANPGNPRAKGRTELLSYCEDLLEEQGRDASTAKTN